MSSKLANGACAIALLTLTGCSPYLQARTQQVSAWAADAECGQGPFEIEVPAIGGRWSESIRVRAYSPRAIAGHVELFEGDERVHSLDFGPARRVPVPSSTSGGLDMAHDGATEADNARCLADAAAIASTATSTARHVPPSSVPGSTPTVASESQEVFGIAPAPGLHEVEWSAPEAYLSSSELQARGLGEISMVHGEWDSSEPARVAMEAGTTLRIRFWSTAPNDLAGVLFVVEQLIGVPSTGDEKWIAHLEEQEREREEARAAPPSRRQRRLRRRAERRGVERQERNRYCDDHHEDEDCWGEGGYAGHQERRLEAHRRVEERRREQAEAEARAPVDPGMPPPPREVSQPPKLSENADWIPGYWHWAGARWAWIGGFWRVPEADVTAGLTATAPAAPPPPQAEETPAQPAANMTWTAGYWMWSGTAYVWVGGSWRIAPQVGATWQGPVWRAGSRGVVLTPGRWLR